MSFCEGHDASGKGLELPGVCRKYCPQETRSLIVSLKCSQGRSGNCVGIYRRQMPQSTNRACAAGGHLEPFPKVDSALGTWAPARRICPVFAVTLGDLRTGKGANGMSVQARALGVVAEKERVLRRRRAWAGVSPGPRAGGDRGASGSPHCAFPGLHLRVQESSG